MKGRQRAFMQHDAHNEYMRNPYYDTKHDPYFLQKKYKDGSHCTTCGVEYRHGTFHWPESVRSNGSTMECPACRRTHEHVPGGILNLKGHFLHSHEQEIRNLIENIAAREQAEHPLQRVISVTSDQEGMEVRTTYEHMTRCIGAGLHHAFKGELNTSYAQDEKFVRMVWMRE